LSLLPKKMREKRESEDSKSDSESVSVQHTESEPNQTEQSHNTCHIPTFAVRGRGGVEYSIYRKKPILLLLLHNNHLFGHHLCAWGASSQSVVKLLEIPLWYVM
jgi:hypothetical protein